MATAPKSTFLSRSLNNARAKVEAIREAAAEALPASVGEMHTSLRQSVVSLNPVQVNETRKLQVAIKASSGPVASSLALGRETQAYAKQVSAWGSEQEDRQLKDEVDRIAFLTFRTGELFADYGGKLEQARIALKDIRNLENDVVNKRKTLAALDAKLASYTNLHSRPTPQQVMAITMTREEVAVQVVELSGLEGALAALKRTKVEEGYACQFAAMKELGEKLALLGGYGAMLLQGMNKLDDEATWKEKTAEVRVESARAVDNWSPLQPYMAIPSSVRSSGGSSIAPTSPFLDKLASRDFESTYSNDLARLSISGGPMSPPLSPSPYPASPTSAKSIIDYEGAPTSPSYFGYSPALATPEKGEKSLT